ncbi:hypothetical protein QQP08_004156 [Theobroma cacao]|nr:hypothetical protein QQP08_004156 [Theobroma cacao]
MSLALKSPNSFLCQNSPIPTTLFRVARLPINPLFVVAAFCSNTKASDSGFNDVAKFYATIMDNFIAYDNLKKSLDQLELQLTTPLDLELLQRLSLKEKLAFRFFTWAAR